MSGGPGLEPKLTRLLEEGARESDFPEERREALFARLAARLPGAAPPPPPPSSHGLARVGKAGALVLLGVALGYGAARALPPSSPRAPARETPVASVEPPPRVVPAPPIAEAPQAVPGPPRPPPRPTPPSASAPSAAPAEIDSVRTTLGEERTLVERGRAAVARRDGLSALEALTAHERAFPDGKLAEERDALLVQALVLAGRGADARRHAREFTERHPGSIFTRRIEETLRELP